VTRLLAERTAATVAVVSRGLEVLAAAAADAAGDVTGDVTGQVRAYLSSPRLAAVLNSTAQTRRSLRLPDVGDAAGVIVAPILVGDDVPAYLMTFGTGQGAGGDRHHLRRRAAPRQRRRLSAGQDPRRRHPAAGQGRLLRLLRRPR
jgi:hypothetical protein